MKDLKKYLLQKPDYLEDFDDEEFGIFYHRYKERFYLDDIAGSILREIKPDYTTEEFYFFKSWVYAFRSTIRKRERRKIEEKSSYLKQIIKTKIGQRLNLTIEGFNCLGIDVQKVSPFRVIKDAEERIFLMPPKAQKRGYALDGITVLNMEGQP